MVSTNVKICGQKPYTPKKVFDIFIRFSCISSMVTFFAEYLATGA